MKVSIRQGVFETNSSSVHSCSITTEKTYNDFVKGKVWICQKWNDEDEYLPVDEAIAKNIEYFKNQLDDISEEDWEKFEKVYKETKNVGDAFYSIGEDWDELKYDDLDSDEYFVSEEDYWNIHEYEDWCHNFTINGEKYVAWGYCGHD